LLNGDTYFNVDLRALKLFAEKKESDWTFSLFSSHDKSRYMRVNADRDGLLHFSAAYRGISRDLVNGGVYWIQPRVFERLSIKVGEVASLEADLLPEIEKEGYRIYGYEFKSTFIDIGLPDDYENAKKIIPSS
jgi:D-glycero-alpha-D-manno-heptose 1-phosphate guanylyltransferase